MHGLGHRSRQAANLQCSRQRVASSLRQRAAQISVETETARTNLTNRQTLRTADCSASRGTGLGRTLATPSVCATSPRRLMPEEKHDDRARTNSRCSLFSRATRSAAPCRGNGISTMTSQTDADCLQCGHRLRHIRTLQAIPVTGPIRPAQYRLSEPNAVLPQVPLAFHSLPPLAPAPKRGSPTQRTF